MANASTGLPSRILLMMVGLAIAFQESPKPAKKQHGAECDASCQAFREVLEARSQQFRPLRGAQIEQNRWQAKIVIPALSAGVCGVAEMPAPVPGMEPWGTYYCILPRAAREAANREFDSVLSPLKAALPKDWHTELLETDEKTRTFRAGPSSEELYVVLGLPSDNNGYMLMFQVSSIRIPTD